MFFPPISFRWLKQKKMLRVKVVCIEVIYHPSNFLPSLKNTLYISRTLSKRLKILHVCEKGLKNCFDLKTGTIYSACPDIYPKHRQKGVLSIFSKTVFVVTKTFPIWTMGVITFHTHILMSLLKFS